MKKFLGSILTTLGFATSSHAGSANTPIDANSLRYSTPTVAGDDLVFVMPTRESFEGAPQFHEDEWRQIEFVAAAKVPETKARLREFKSFEERHRTEHGWTDIHARRMQQSIVIGGPDAVAEVASALAAERLPAPILTTASRPLGQVKGGFTLRIATSVIIYGVSTSEGIVALAASVDQGGDDAVLTKAFAVLNRKWGVALVDWRSQLVLLSAAEGGKVSVWNP